MKFSDAYSFLLALPRFDKSGAASLKPGFDRIDALLDTMGNPQNHYHIAHIAGTNGKGSTASMLSAIVTASGAKAGLHTSPHLLSPTERLRVDGEPASEDWLAARVDQFRSAIEAIGPSFFEAIAAFSFLRFAEEGVDVAVIEVGLGGRLDATNIVQPDVCLITSIGIDHTSILGNTVEEIAKEKAGIIKPYVPVFTSNVHDGVVKVLRDTAKHHGAPFETTQEHFSDVWLRVVDDRVIFDAVTSVNGMTNLYRGLQLDLVGRHQLGNALLAVAGAEVLLHKPGKPIAVGLRNVRKLSGLRGRLELLDGPQTAIVDVAHNVDGIACGLRLAGQRCKDGGTLHVAIGLMKDKTVEQIAPLLLAHADAVSVVEIDSDRATNPNALSQILSSYGLVISQIGKARTILDSFRESAKHGDVLLITGSHQVASQVLDY